MTSLLDGVEAIYHRRGAIFEAIIFSFLFDNAQVIRSFEFALADGAIDCLSAFNKGESWADRHHIVSQDVKRQPGIKRFLYFDVKSKTSAAVAGTEVYSTNVLQRSRVAFYIGICASDPSFVEVIPNYHQSRFDNLFDAEKRYVAVNITRKLPFERVSYRFDPTSAMFRMPIRLLPEAIDRISQCAQGKGHYTNPWNRVEFREWRPVVYPSDEFLRPRIDTQHFTSYLAIMRIYLNVYVEYRCKLSPLTLDFVQVQPRLADFKFVLDGKQYFIQHKLDYQVKLKTALLNSVAISRDNTPYFSTTDRFDFLFYEFNAARSDDPKGETSRCALFIPEKNLPDRLFSTHDTRVDLHGLSKWLINLDRDGHWVDQVVTTIRENPMPRTPISRPSRTTSQISETPQVVTTPRLTDKGETEDSIGSSHDARHFFTTLMTRCAKMRSGLVIILAARDPNGDFAYCRYAWSEEEARIFLECGKPPRTIHDLPAGCIVSPFFYFSRKAECTITGGTFTPSQYRRLNSCSTGRLIIWSLWGADAAPSTMTDPPMALIPSLDFEPTENQHNLFKTNIGLREAEAMPDIASLLCTGYLPADYNVCTSGPFIYTSLYPASAGLLDLLDKFVSSIVLEHPIGHERDGRAYRMPLWKLHQGLLREPGFLIDPSNHP